MWPDRRILDLFKIESPILLAPMAGAIDAEIAIAVAEGGGLASVPCALISAEKAPARRGADQPELLLP
jgi:nitronate monooxygenase